MTLDSQQLILLGLLTSSVHWLVARSSTFKPLWFRATGVLDSLLRCAACSGWWLGLGAGALGVRPVSGPPMWAEILLAGLLGVWVTPVAEGVLVWGLTQSSLWPVEFWTEDSTGPWPDEPKNPPRP